MPDINFDPLVERFKEKIYGSSKGKIREHIIFGQLEAHLHNEKEGLRCADIGGGFGQVTRWLVAKGHQVDYCDLSTKMADMAINNTCAQDQKKIKFFQCAFQDADLSKYDFVHCQAVLEWLEQPERGIEKLCELVDSGGSLMLIFYNINAIKLRNLIRGNLRAAFSGSKGDGTGLTPINPLNIEHVIKHIQRCGFVIEKQFGVRCFTDFQEKNTTKRLPDDALIAAEQSLCEQEPWRSIARYVGVIARRGPQTLSDG